ncbi:hypothetical protein SAMN05216304_1021045 [Bosea sp. OK403]|nr:hypothetical protein SAMN05216304_1021045 [Bosea sp. OK403]
MMKWSMVWRIKSVPLSVIVAGRREATLQAAGDVLTIDHNAAPLQRRM